MTLLTRSINLLRKSGWVVEIVEKWNAHAKVRKDLFGMFDLVAIRDGVTMGVQVTSYSNIAARVSKIKTNPVLRHLLDAGWVVCVHGWKKDKGKWTCAVRNIGGEE